jgi:hypothetical protein
VARNCCCERNRWLNKSSTTAAATKTSAAPSQLLPVPPVPALFLHLLLLLVLVLVLVLLAQTLAHAKILHSHAHSCNGKHTGPKDARMSCSSVLSHNTYTRNTFSTFVEHILHIQRK